MNDVRIDGVRYVPVTKRPNSFHKNRLERVLASECPYLSKSVRNSIVKKFQEDDDVERKVTKPKNTGIKKPQKSPSYIFNYKNFKGFDEKGHILYKRGGKKHSIWTIHNVIDIKQWIDFGRKDKTSIEYIANKVGLTENVVNKIIYNLKNGELLDWVDKWIAQSSSTKKSVPVENNPQKRKDLGWF